MISKRERTSGSVPVGSSAGNVDGGSSGARRSALARRVDAAFRVTLTGVLEPDAAPGSAAGVGLFREPWQRQL